MLILSTTHIGFLITLIVTAAAPVSIKLSRITCFIIGRPARLYGRGSTDSENEEGLQLDNIFFLNWVLGHASPWGVTPFILFTIGHL